MSKALYFPFLFKKIDVYQNISKFARKECNSHYTKGRRKSKAKNEEVLSENCIRRTISYFLKSDIIRIVL